MDSERLPDVSVNDGPLIQGPRFWFITLDVDVAQSPFGLIDWEKMYLWFVESDVGPFPLTKRYLDISTMEEVTLRSPITVPQYSDDQCHGLIERMAYSRDAMGMYITPRLHPRWGTSYEQFEDGVINKIFKKLKALVVDPRIMNLKARQQVVHMLFGPDTTISNSELVFGDSHAKCSAYFRRYITACIRKGVAP